MRSPLRSVSSIVLLIALVAIRVWLRSGSTPGSYVPPPPRTPQVEQAHVVAEEPPKREFKPFPSGSLRGKECHFAFGVYHDPRPLKAPAEVVATLVPRFPGLHFSPDASKAKSLPVFKLEELDAKDLKPPDEESLKYCGHGLSAIDGARLQKCERASVFLFMGDAGQAFAVLKQGHEFVKAFAAETGGFLWDEATRECFTADAWDNRGQAGWDGDLPVVSRHMTIHLYRNGPMARAVTLGMTKFGLPDVCAVNLTVSESPQIQSLINIACQTMVERGSLERAGFLALDIRQLRCTPLRVKIVGSLADQGTGKGDLEVAVGTPDEGDADNRLIELRFDRSPGASTSEKRLAWIAAFFGSRDSLVQVQHDEELLAARDRARVKLLGPVKAEFLKGLNPGEKLIVKAPFRNSTGGNEWMWVEVLEWKGEEITGILMNDPDQCPGLKCGAHVVSKEDSLFDYIRSFADGHDEGNETGKIMAKREKESGGR